MKKQPLSTKKSSSQQKDQAFWQAPDWYNALSLTERIAHKQASPHAALPQQQEQLQKASRRLSSWKAQAPFDHTLFAERLASDSLTEEELLAFLAETAADIKGYTPSLPNWLATFTTIFSEASDDITALPVSQEMIEQHPLGLYLHVIGPLLQYASTTLHKGIQALQQRYSVQPFDEQQVCQNCINTLALQLLFQISKTIVLEMHVARMQGHLQGETPAERFINFAQRLSRQERRLSLFAEYPVLARHLVSTIDFWAQYALETLDHLCADWPDLQAVLAPEHDPGLLVEIQGGAGDKHRQGRSVQILKFSSGWRVLYKPKPLAIDKHFQELLTWLNERGAQPPLRALKVLDCGEYGWTEFVEAASCTSQEEVASFYERQGEYLALLYALNANDCHSENVIASGADPMIVDLESLFHPSVDFASEPQSEGFSVSSAASQWVDLSVQRVGLLPEWSWSSEDSPGVDVSGLGGQPGQMMPRPLPAWDEIRTDQMRMTLQKVQAPTSQNRPHLNDCDVEVLDYKKNIVAGFTSMYRLLMRVREELLTEQLPRFAHDEIRVILRPTRFYALILSSSFHPDLLRDALERDRYFDRLWLGVEHWPDLATFIPAERHDLSRGDIPMFTTFLDSHAVFTADGEPITDLYKTSALELTQQRIQNLDERDLTLQTWLIKASLFIPRLAEGKTSPPSLPLLPTQQPVDRAQLLTLAQAVGKRLADLVLPIDEYAYWPGVIRFGERQWSVTPVDINLYDGLSGITLFNAYLGSITGDEHFTSLARLALNSIRKRLKAYKKEIREGKPEEREQEAQYGNIGAFEGWGSFVYLFTQLGALWNEPALLHEAEELSEYLPALIARDESLDIMNGSAGCLLSLLSLYAVHPAPRVLEIAIQCGDRLLATAQTLPAGVGWVTHEKEQPLGGFSHGGAGIALSLFKLAEASGEERYRQTALRALAYDRSLFVPEQQNWADLRTDPLVPTSATTETEPPAPVTPATAQRFMLAWCHGAPGIGLARLGALDQLDDEQVREEIDIALHTTTERGLGLNHSLCHGVLGNTDLLLTAAHQLNRPEDHKRLEQALAIIVGSIDTFGWVTGLPFGVEIPGLMTGLAGIGYGLLRLAAPDKVPSVLLVAPPYIDK